MPKCKFSKTIFILFSNKKKLVKSLKVTKFGTIFALIVLYGINIDNNIEKYF